MAIPYEIKSLMPGRLQLKSAFLKYLDVSAETLENFVLQREGVNRVRVNKKTGSLTIIFEHGKFDLEELFEMLNNADPDLVLQILSQAEAENNHRKPAHRDDGNSRKWFYSTTLGLAPFVLRSSIPGGVLSGLTITLALPIFKKALNSLRNRKIDVHLLDSGALTLAALRGNAFSSMFMVWLLSLGDLIEEHTQGRAHKEISKLLSYEDEKAWLITDGGDPVEVSVDHISKGDYIVVYTGEKIPIDGVVDRGEALVNQASLTGEANPVLKKNGDNVYAGTFIEDGKLHINVEKVGKETALAKIVQIIEDSLSEPIEVQKKAENVANKFVIPTIMVSGGAYTFTGNINRAISTLTFDYHTGIHVSTPTSIMSHMALAAKKGILFKGGRHLEILHSVDTVVFDKTGTLTVGHPQITDIVSYGVEKEDALRYAASLEQRLTHPVAKSIVHKAEESGLKLLPRRDSAYHRGLGIEANLNGGRYLIGSTKFIEKKNISIPDSIEKDVARFHAKGESVLYLLRKEEIIGLIGFADPIREESKDVVQKLREMGREVILCTGDNEGAAKVVAKNLGIEKYFARAFPDEKANIIKSLKKEGRTVAFLGDGVNDSPALSVSDIGFSINSGADIAIEVADVVINNNLGHLIDAIKLSDLALKNIGQNYAINNWSNSIGMFGAITGKVNPVIATMINNGISILIGLNALKPLWHNNYMNLNGKINYNIQGGDNNGNEKR